MACGSPGRPDGAAKGAANGPSDVRASGCRPSADPSAPADPGKSAVAATDAAEGATVSRDSDIGPDAGDEPSGPVRSCALSRQEFAIAELVRFVRAPDGTIVPDIAGKLPGRGVWVEARRSVLVEAVRRNVFAKSLKKPCTADEGLCRRVEDLMLRRLIDALGIANKAGLVVTGFEKVSAKIEASEVIALLHGSDAAVDGVGKLDRKFAAIGKSTRPGFDLESVIVTELTIDEMSLAIGRPNVVHAGLRSGGATLRLLENALRLRRFRAARA